MSPDAGRRHYDTVADQVLALVKRWGPALAVVVTVGSFGSCALYAAQAFGFTPATAGSRLEKLEGRTDVLERGQRDVHQDAKMVQLFLCSSTNLNDTQQGICADWRARRTP